MQSVLEDPLTKLPDIPRSISTIYDSIKLADSLDGVYPFEDHDSVLRFARERFGSDSDVTEFLEVAYFRLDDELYPLIARGILLLPDNRVRWLGRYMKEYARRFLKDLVYPEEFYNYVDMSGFELFSMEPIKVVMRIELPRRRIVRTRHKHLIDRAGYIDLLGMIVATYVFDDLIPEFGEHLAEVGFVAFGVENRPPRETTHPTCRPVKEFYNRIISVAGRAGYSLPAHPERISSVFGLRYLPMYAVDNDSEV